ncbi:MAG: fumarylacetoacetate hydrolase family protein [Gemmatimonadetes bacterium]|nr:fumarylacetoacetate hydrolase family protein [Gemmatimonadota bacterium]
MRSLLRPSPPRRSPLRLRYLPLLALVAVSAVAGLRPAPLAAQAPVRYVRYRIANDVAWGRIEGASIVQLRGAPWADPTPTGMRVLRTQVQLLAPAAPSKVIAVGLNYKSHLGERPSAAYPGLFAKLPTSIVADGEEIQLPPDAKNVHYEGEMVLVIGRRARDVSPAEAKAHVFGVTVGNDVSERDWQKNDLQWFRAKAADTFGPLGPELVTGVNYEDLLLQTRLNGEVVQSQRTKDLLFDVATIVSYVSRYVTLEPGDVIYTGTPGTTKPMKVGDVVEVELEGVGVLRNPVMARR